MCIKSHDHIIMIIPTISTMNSKLIALRSVVLRLVVEDEVVDCLSTTTMMMTKVVMFQVTMLYEKESIFEKVFTGKGASLF